MTGGETGIRTLETVARLHAFQACAFDHSATSPARAGQYSNPRRAQVASDINLHCFAALWAYLFN